MSVDLSPGYCSTLRSAFERVGYDADGVLRLLGDSAHAALSRGEPEPARRATRDGGALGGLVRLFLLGDTLSEREVRTILPWPESVAGCAAEWRPEAEYGQQWDGRSPGLRSAGVDLRFPRVSKWHCGISD